MKPVAMKKRSALPFALIGPLLLSAQTYSASQTFGDGGAVSVDVANGSENVNTHILLPDGKLLLAGDGYDITINSYFAGLMKIDTVCGALDTTFGNGGLASVTFEQRTRAFGFAVQPDGKIIGCGMIAPSNARSQQWPGVFRLNADGSVDTSFNGTGYNRLPFNSGSGDLTACFVNGDGTITCTGAGFSTGIGAFRFLPDGTMDDTFGTGGMAVIALPGSAGTDHGNGIMRPDGSVVSITMSYPGSGNNYFLALAQFDANGDPDPTFGTGGLAFTTVPVNHINSIAGGLGASLMADGRILVSGTAVNSSNGGFLMARFLPNGDLDSTYAVNGVSNVSPATDFHVGCRHELLSDGSTIQFGWAIYGNAPICLKRDADGQVVSGFGVDGYVYADFGQLYRAFTGGLSLPGGRIIAYGNNQGNQFLALRMTTGPDADALPVITEMGSGLSATGSGAFQWYLEGTPLPGETAPTIMPTQNGIYTVTMTVSPDCSFTSDPFDLQTVGFTDLGARPFLLHVDEGDGTILVVNNGPQAVYRLTDLLGRPISSGTLMQGSNRMDLRGMRSGIFLLSAVSARGAFTERFVHY
jgi:uncharacterized delta-60 repeat protein